MFYTALETIAGFLYFIPVVLWLFNRKLHTKFFVFFVGYWTWCGLVNLVLSSGMLKNEVLNLWLERFFNLLDAPLMVFILYNTTEIRSVRDHLHKLVRPFIVSVGVLLAVTRLNPVTDNFVVGIGILVVLCYIIWIVYKNVSQTKTGIAASNKQFIYYALLFEYGTSLITFVFSYLLTPPTETYKDIFLIFHISIIVSMCIVMWSFLSYRGEPIAQKKMPVKRMDVNAEIKYL